MPTVSNGPVSKSPLFSGNVDGVGVAVGDGVGVMEFCTVTSIEVCASRAPPLAYALAAMLCVPFGTVVEFQLKVYGGEEVQY